MRWESSSARRPEIERDGSASRWWLPTPSGERIGPLVDPMATQLRFGPAHERHRPDLWSVERPWPAPRPQRHTTRPLVVYEAHVKGMTRRHDREDRGTFPALIDELPRLADLGVSVIELMPVQQFDPADGNYWGYMPVVFGAVHQQYASDPERAPEELAAFVAAAHDLDVEVWLDVVFNHTSEEDEHGPLHHLRALGRHPDGSPDGPRHDYYVVDDRGRLADESGTGNTIDVRSPAAQDLIRVALDRFADLGVDGFRFDLATILAREPDFVRSIGDWGDERGVRLVAEAWDMVRYQVGRDWPDARWKQWNGPFRDDMRSFLRGEPGQVWAVMRRVAGSPDLFGEPSKSINFMTAHDGFTMYDLVAYDRKHNRANGEGGADGSGDNRSWNSGHEGDDDVPSSVMELRRRQLRNAMCLLMLSAGVPMFVAGDEFARTQQGNNNAYNQDNEISWLDWEYREAWLDHEAFVGDLIAFRATLDWRGVQFFGSQGEPDLAHHSRSLAWYLPRSEVYVIANMWWEPLRAQVQVEGPWRRVIDTADARGVVDAADAPAADGRAATVDRAVTVGPRSIVVLRRAQH